MDDSLVTESLQRVKYFAYGSNMCDTVILERCPHRIILGAARLDNYRLAFRRKLKTGTGAADILSSPSMTVWGVLYEIDQDDLAELDLREGYKINDLSNSIYERIKISVTLKTVEGESLHNNVEAYTVSKQHKQLSDIPPSSNYIDNMIAGALTNKLPSSYIAFLRWLKREVEKARKPHNLLVFSTSSREDSKGLGLLKVSDSVARSLKLHNFAAVLYEKKVCLVQVVTVSSAHSSCELDHNSCELDQSVRHIIGIPGRETYGFRVNIFPVTGNRSSFPLVKPRTLMLKAFPPALLDSEKNICVLHENNIRLLGLAEGEYVRISTVRLDKNNQYQIREINL
jgi:gamma-glutamylcyclotransferase